MSTKPTEVVVLGAGIIGLSVAHVLSSHGTYKVKVVARDMPEDLDSQAFSTPWAGANWSPIGEFNERTYKWESTTFNKFWDLIPSGLAISSDSKVFYDDRERVDDLWYKTLVRDFRVLPASDVPASAKAGVAFKTVSVCPDAYLPWIKSELIARGVEFVRKRVATLGEAAALAGPNGVLVNATGLGARSLIGLEDKDVFPIRGQTMVIDNPKVNEFISLPLGAPSVNGEATYIIPRPKPGGGCTTILGGCYQKDNWDTSFDAETARGILARCTALAPAIADKETRVLKHNVGLRPARRGGPRIDVQWVDVPLTTDWLAKDLQAQGPSGRVMVVHAYGFGPAGYQMSWGAAEEVDSLVTANLKNF